MENYRPQLYLRTADITVGLHWPEGTPNAAEKMVMPGDNVEMVCDLVHEAAAEVGTRFTLREGGKTSERFYPISLTPIFTYLSWDRSCDKTSLNGWKPRCHFSPLVA